MQTFFVFAWYRSSMGRHAFFFGGYDIHGSFRSLFVPAKTLGKSIHVLRSSGVGYIRRWIMNRDSRQTYLIWSVEGHFLRSLQDDRWMELKIIAATIFEQESMKTCKTVHPRSFYPRRATGRPDSAETRTRFAPCDSIPRIQTIPTGSAVLRKHHKHGSRKKTLTTAKTFTGISFLNWLRFSMNPQHRIRI